MTTVFPDAACVVRSTSKTYILLKRQLKTRSESSDLLLHHIIQGNSATVDDMKNNLKVVRQIRTLPKIIML